MYKKPDADCVNVVGLPEDSTVNVWVKKVMNHVGRKSGAELLHGGGLGDTVTLPINSTG